jgi:hypothetical protein
VVRLKSTTASRSSWPGARSQRPCARIRTTHNVMIDAAPRRVRRGQVIPSASIQMLEELIA